MHDATRQLLMVLAEVADAYLTTSHAPLSNVLRAWRDAGMPNAETSSLPPSEQCCYIGRNGVRCLGINSFGGFCPDHDTLIHNVGGDNSPIGSSIIGRSALHLQR